MVKTVHHYFPVRQEPTSCAVPCPYLCEGSKLLVVSHHYSYLQDNSNKMLVADATPTNFVDLWFAQACRLSNDPRVACLEAQEGG